MQSEQETGGTDGDEDQGGSAAEYGEGAIRAPNDTGPPARREWEAVHSTDPLEQIRVLHVDDDPPLLSVTEEFLRREDDRIQVETATDARTGLDRITAGAFDVVVSDYEMPEMDGLAFLERLRERGEEIPFIVFTGQSREEIAVDALNLGADRYLQKGTDPESQYGLLADAIVQETRHRRAEVALRESEERYRTLVEAFPDIVFITDYESRMCWANDALERQTGLTVEDFQMSQTENPFIHPGDAERVAEQIGAFLESDARYSEPIDNRFIDEEGTLYWYSSLLTKTTYDGEPALQFITRNITERKERERRLDRVNRRYRTLLERFPDGLVAFFDADLRYDAVSGALLAALPVEAAEIEGERVDEVTAAPLAAVPAPMARDTLRGESGTTTTQLEEMTLEIRLHPVTTGAQGDLGMALFVPRR